ncbi:MAG: glucans biosynthesis glucosyltransferase MdoH, partial [Oricola sp.]|nr:glucans biosynthesis glucosyltransferase MdoH [Oricola sp.]
DHMLVFDADSYLDASTMIELVRRMERSPETGLIQTIPRLVGGKTLFARWQQFAASAYGPFLGAGIGWWGQNEGNFWGHNAIIRVRAFAEAAGLPVMPGGTPFGGAILSHDFVEAALLRKAGWRVEIASDLGGSWEESPPTILDLTIRDRRWCQGNLQHIGVLFRTRGLTWTSRLHLMTGIMAYLASPMWLMLILAGMALSLQGNFLRPDYFGEASLFPNWPVIDSARALRLFIATMALLFAPKLYGLIIGLASARWRKTVGVIAMTCSVFVEIVISMLIAPILMAAQTSAVAAVLTGRDGGWSPQARDAGGHPIALLARRHAMTTFFGVALFASALIISPIFAAWLSPAALGLIFSIPISKATGSVRAGKAFRKLGLLVTPAEVDPPPSYVAALESDNAFRDLNPPPFAALLRSRGLRDRRAGLVDGHWALAEADVHSPLVIGAAKAK